MTHPTEGGIVTSSVATTSAILNPASISPDVDGQEQQEGCQSGVMIQDQGQHHHDQEKVKELPNVCLQTADWHGSTPLDPPPGCRVPRSILTMSRYVTAQVSTCMPAQM